MNSRNPIKLSITLLNYNRLEDTRRTIGHLRRLIEGRNDCEVIAVDNASIDGTRAFLREQRDWLTLVEMEQNTGIAGLNAGFENARGDYILVLDDDSFPESPETLDRIVQCLDSKPEVGVVACGIVSAEGKTKWSWHLPRNNQSGPSMAFVGCGFAIRRDLFREIGWFPGRFFIYQNEMDVAVKVLQQGYQIQFEPQCRVVHLEASGGRTGWRQVYFPTRNTIWLIRKYYPSFSAMYMIFSRLCIGLARAVQTGEYRWYFRAVRDGFGEGIQRQVMARPLRLRFVEFRRQNSLVHQMMTWFGG